VYVALILYRDHEARSSMFVLQETNPFTYVEINGLKIPEPSAAYNLLWEGVSGHDTAKNGHLRIGAKESLNALTRHFSGGGGRGRGPGGHAW
jgi:origin recognition complex subunit 1